MDASVVKSRRAHPNESRERRQGGQFNAGYGLHSREFRAFETALYQVLHRTTTNELLKMIQQVRGQKGFEAWHTTVRRCGQRNTSDRSSAYAALISLGNYVVRRRIARCAGEYHHRQGHDIFGKQEKENIHRAPQWRSA